MLGWVGSKCQCALSSAMAASWRTLLLLLCCAVLRSEGSCFGRDASFTPGAKPVVTQPSRNDPSKVMVDWSKIVKNAQCVDKFVVWMWPDGTERIGKSAVSKEVSKTTMSAIMDMEACVNYRFAVELDEKEMTGNKKFSGATLQNCWAGQGVEFKCQRLHRGLPLGPSPSSNLSLSISSSHHVRIVTNIR